MRRQKLRNLGIACLVSTLTACATPAQKPSISTVVESDPVKTRYEQAVQTISNALIIQGDISYKNELTSYKGNVGLYTLTLYQSNGVTKAITVCIPSQGCITDLQDGNIRSSDNLNLNSFFSISKPESIQINYRNLILHLEQYLLTKP